MQAEPSRDRGTRLAEIVGSLSLATDLASGWPLEHGLRRSLIAVWLGTELGIDQGELSDTYYVALLGSVGCAIESTLFAEYTTDDIAAASRTATVDFTNRLSTTAFALRTFGAGQPPVRRVRSLVSAAMAGSSQFQAVCRDVAVRVAEMIDIGESTQQALAQCHERWNGRGGPKRLRGDEIRLAARIFHVAHDAEIYHRLGGPEAAATMARRRAGRLYDPAVAERFADIAPSLFHRLEAEPIWEAVLAAEPAPVRELAEVDVDTVTESIAKFVDLRSSYTLGHSSAVGRLAAGAAMRLGLTKDEARTIRRAGLLHDLGRLGVPVAVWDRSQAWGEREWERARRHPALTELVLARSTTLGPIGTLAGLHHERLDGSGYRGVTAAAQPVAARILAAADVYQTKLERRPHRAAVAPDVAATYVRDEAGRGRLDGDVVEALLAAEGRSVATPTLSEPPAPLSQREVEVLRLLARGLSNREMAEILVISPKTVGHHVQHIYDKLGISTRVGATLFALQHGVVGDETDPTAK